MEYVFELPTFLMLPRKTIADKKLYLNMNTNLDKFAYRDAKRLFEPLAIPKQFAATKIQISYLAEKPTKRRFDTLNVISLIDKFFLDWLVKNEYIPDDTCNNVEYKSITGANGTGRDRVLATITVLEK